MNVPGRPALLFSGGLAVVVVGLICCASLMAGAQSRMETELLAHGHHHRTASAQEHKLNSESLSARQGAQDALVRASRDALQADLLHEALGGGHPWRHMKNAAAAAAAKAQHIAAVHNSQAWKAGERALAQRNPWAAIDGSLWKQVDAATQTALAAESKGAASAEKHFVSRTHVHTHNVHAGDVDHSSKALIGSGAGHVTSGHKAYREEERASAVHMTGQHRMLSELLAHNHAAAPTLAGGVSVPGGHVVWLPLKSLSSSGTKAHDDERRLAEADQKASRDIEPPRAPVQALQFPKEYSKIVEYGANGQPIATIFGPESYATAARSSSRGRGTSHAAQSLSSAPHPRKHAVQRLAGGGDDDIDDVNEAKVEQDIVFRLLHDYGAPEMDTGTTMTPEQKREADKRAGRLTENGEDHEWYTFGGRVFEGAGTRGMPSVLLTLTATLLALVAAL